MCKCALLGLECKCGKADKKSMKKVMDPERKVFLYTNGGGVHISLNGVAAAITNACGHFMTGFTIAEVGSELVVKTGLMRENLPMNTQLQLTRGNCREACDCTADRCSLEVTPS